MKYTIVKAHDVDEAVTLIKEHFQVAGLKYSESRTRAFITDLVYSCGLNGKVLLLLIDDDGVPVGYLAGVVVQHLYLDVVFATELGFYCKAKGQGKKLIEAFEVWAEDQGASRVIMASINDPDQRLTPYYNRLGYKLTDTTYAKDLN